MELANTIEAILFYEAEPMTIKRLSTLLKRTESDVQEALNTLQGNLSTTGLRLITNGNEVTLGTSPEASTLLEAITKEELSKELSKASLETLAIVLYKGPVTRAEIDYVRGVNSTFILRNLLIRGLVEKIDNPSDQRSFLYKPTFQLLEHMGVTRIEDLPQYHDTLATLANFVVTATANDETKEIDEETSVEEIPNESSGGDDYQQPSNLEADVREEDETLKNFDDEALTEHRKEDELGL